jgi:hypothetical protein
MCRGSAGGGGVVGALPFAVFHYASVGLEKGANGYGKGKRAGDREKGHASMVTGGGGGGGGGVAWTRPCNAGPV